MENQIPIYRPTEANESGFKCLKIICKYYGKNISIEYIHSLLTTVREGNSLFVLSNAAENIGFRSLGVQVDFNVFCSDVPFPCIVNWSKNYFVVVNKIDKNRNVHISDPSNGQIIYTKEEFVKFWIGNDLSEKTMQGTALILETTPAFFSIELDGRESKVSFTYLFKYLLKYKSFIIHLSVGLLAGSLLSLVFPFLTQSIVDIGIQNQDLNFIYLVLLAQVMLFIGRMGIEIIRSWILIHLSARINISLISDFFIKLMKLPISYFDTKMTGDIMQRINDHSRIEQLLTNSSLSTLFSVVNMIVFSIVLLLYDYRLFIFYSIGAILYVGWIAIFLQKRKQLDYSRFLQVSQEQSKVIELIDGMQDIKMNNAEKQKRWDWEFLQVKLFKIRIKALSLEQWQSVGGDFINHIKDILVSFISAKLVITGNLTLGMMLSVQYIIGQLNGPLLQVIDFIKQSQDAKISLERLGEIHDKEEEENEKGEYVSEIPKRDIEIDNASFKYEGSDCFIFQNLNLTIPYKKVTAIVGASGSGKTTLLKLLMKFYEPDAGEITVGHTKLKNISPTNWRDHCGVILQEGYIFNDTIANNIAVGEDYVDKGKLRKAVQIANIQDFIEDLPLSYNTKIGNEGMGISGGQKQRLFIARAVYKSPEYIFFDEATSSLDANNERIIMGNLEKFFRDKTAVIIAHRLSTVKHADKIIVLDKGKVVEEGDHQKLVDLRGEYYKLVKNQLELGS